jgi:hypothetical protein
MVVRSCLRVRIIGGQVEWRGGAVGSGGGRGRRGSLVVFYIAAMECVEMLSHPSKVIYPSLAAG